ncbi:MAG: MurR/RpiR family transcriptional regulator [Thermomicrobiales bacterium]|nr:MurR/RpiR family transcriptional regulator [Thermomicrobiales bacterium]
MAPGRPARLPAADCLTLIEQHLPTLSGASRAVAEMILRDPWAVLDMTIADVAAESGVSLPSVTRFCRAAGYPGFRELTQELARSLGRIDSRGFAELPAVAADADGLPGLAARIVARQIGALEDTLRVLDYAEVERAVATLIAAARVAIVGSGGAYASALGVAVKLNWAGIPATASSPDQFANQLVAISPGDVVVAISHQGRTRDTIGAVRQARAFGAATIGIATVPNAPLLAATDIALAAFSRDLARSGTLLIANHAELFVGDVLAAAIAERRRNDSPSQRESVADWIEANLRVRPAAARNGRATNLVPTDAGGMTRDG